MESVASRLRPTAKLLPALHSRTAAISRTMLMLRLEEEDARCAMVKVGSSLFQMANQITVGDAGN